MGIFGTFSVYQLAVATLSILLCFSASCSNSTSQIKVSSIEVIDKRAQLDPSPTSSIRDAKRCDFDEKDDSAPTSLRSLRNDFNEADIVVLAEVLSLAPNNRERGYRPYTLTAKIKESFKGGFKPGEIITYGYVFEVYDEEPNESKFLGEQVLWLHRWNDGGMIRYGQIEFMWGGINCDILEKLRKISKGN